MRQCYRESANPEERAAEPAGAKRRIWSRGRTGPSSPRDDSANSPVGMTNEHARKSGSLQRKIIRASPFKKVGSFFAFIVSDQPLASTQTSK
ncbi:hypothetical protein T12_15631 [Trichinella patagoniensis]|uniref:Uncharacterized protein n=1 Tax=Trichinella patagoniensis TaxID=990121 RepID=A0A0V1A2L7_9BILA|nr:hypothetical protein T12_15631 [Trichinella patagoniensis]